MTQEQKQFYRHTLQIAVPIMIQNGITNIVSLIDNVMVGRIGTDPMSGVAIVNQLVFVWNLMIFGGLSGIGIFTAQFYGKGDHEGVRHTFRLQLYLAVILLLLGLLAFTQFDSQLIRLYLHADSGIGNIDETFVYAKQYLQVILIGFAPFALTQVYSNTLKSSGETLVPMKASAVAVAVNLIGNYALIFGHFGFPRLGVVGAACATVAARFVEMIYNMVWTAYHADRQPFIKGAFRSLYVPGQLVRECIKKGTPLLVNETLWSAGQAVLAQQYAIRGLSVVAAYNICSTVGNVFNVAFIAMGVAIGIILGQELGQGRTDTVMEDARRLRYFSLLICFGTVIILFLVSGIFPRIYNTSPEIQNLAAGMIRVMAVFMPFDCYANATYFTLRSGGKTLITFLFDSCFSWAVWVPTAFCLVHFTDLSILVIYGIILSLQGVKCIIGYQMVKRGIWIHDITAFASSESK